MKWIVLVAALGGDFLLLLAHGIVAYCLSPFFAIVLAIPTYYSWKKTGGFSNWKLSNMKSFLKNWEE